MEQRPYDKKKRESNRESGAKYSQILIKPYRAAEEAIRAAAAAAGKSLQGYILEAVREKMDREK